MLHLSLLLFFLFSLLNKEDDDGVARDGSGTVVVTVQSRMVVVWWRWVVQLWNKEDDDGDCWREIKKTMMVVSDRELETTIFCWFGGGFRMMMVLPAWWLWTRCGVPLIEWWEHLFNGNNK